MTYLVMRLMISLIFNNLTDSDIWQYRYPTDSELYSTGVRESIFLTIFLGIPSLRMSLLLVLTVVKVQSKIAPLTPMNTVIVLII